MKMAAEVRWLYYAALFFVISLQVSGNAPLRRFEYKYSFKPPYLAQKDGSVPFWEYGGNAIASSENVRIAPSLRSQKGAIWTKVKTNFDWWEVDIIFRVTGRGRIGADGLAFWYTENKGAYDGAVDGTTQLLAGCLRDFRNKPFPTRAKIEYYQNTLTVLFLSGMTNNEQDFEVCLRAENVILPKSGHFGVSAATGGLADDHDVLHFLTTSLHPPGQVPSQGTGVHVSEEEQRKLSQEYADYQRKLDQQKEEYRREHPEAATKDKDNEFEEWFESDNQRELRQIFTGQSQMFETLRELHRKLDEVVGRQERTLSLLSSVSAGGIAGGQPVQGGTPGQPITLTQEVHMRSDSILQNQARQPTAQVQSVGYDMASLVNEMRDGLNTVKRDVAAASQRLSGGAATPGGCPPQTACLSTTIFLVFAVVQLCIILGTTEKRKQRSSTKTISVCAGFAFISCFVSFLSSLPCVCACACVC
ncbi:Protein ERGIC-53 [Blattella germanica]|nr:Protein ERGIC-53 [Blattella germanica]